MSGGNFSIENILSETKNSYDQNAEYLQNAVTIGDESKSVLEHVKDINNNTLAIKNKYTFPNQNIVDTDKEKLRNDGARLSEIMGVLPISETGNIFQQYLRDEAGNIESKIDQNIVSDTFKDLFQRINSHIEGQIPADAPRMMVFSKRTGSEDIQLIIDILTAYCNYIRELYVNNYVINTVAEKNSLVQPNYSQPSFMCTRTSYRFTIITQLRTGYRTAA